MQRLNRMVLAVVILLIGSPIPVSAAYINQFTPQGEVPEANRATAVFSDDMVRLGDTTGAAPFRVACAAPGNGRWSDPRTWTYSLLRGLEPGERCTFYLNPGLKTLAGREVSGQHEFVIVTPGPWVSRLQPYKNSRIEEDQIFLITPRMAVKP